MGRLTDQVAIVTGASRGIGRAIALKLAQEGAHVVVNYRSQEEAASAVVQEIEALGREAVAVAANVTVEAEVRRMVTLAMRRFRRVDILVNNAGATADQLLALMTLEQWESVVQTNLRGPFLCIREVLPHMIRRKAGCIINLSSIAADHAGRGHANYVATKGGLNAMTRSLAVEMASKGIRVNAVAPGMIVTEMSQRVRDAAEDEILAQIPLKRFGQPEEVADAVCFLASDEARYITGEVLRVAGGMGL